MYIRCGSSKDLYCYMSLCVCVRFISILLSIDSEIQNRTRAHIYTNNCKQIKLYRIDSKHLVTITNLNGTEWKNHPIL